MRFEWNERKNQSNFRKHGVDFEEAATAFLDSNGLVLDDEQHSDEEERFVLLALSTRPRLLAVVHCLRGREGNIRIISARRATIAESERYSQRWQNEEGI